MSSYSSLTDNNNCNYNCQVCRKSGKLPNIAGRFYLINDTQCKCNGCNTVFDKSEYYAKPRYENDVDGPWVFPSSDISTIKLDNIRDGKNIHDHTNIDNDLETLPIVNTQHASSVNKIYKYFSCCR